MKEQIFLFEIVKILFIKKEWYYVWKNERYKGEN